MKLEQIKNKIGWIILGVVIAISAFHAWTVYTLVTKLQEVSAIVQQDNARVNQIVDFLNKVTAQAEPAKK